MNVRLDQPRTGEASLWRTVGSTSASIAAIVSLRNKCEQRILDALGRILRVFSSPGPIRGPRPQKPAQNPIPRGPRTEEKKNPAAGSGGVLSRSVRGAEERLCPACLNYPNSRKPVCDEYHNCRKISSP